MTEKQIVYGYCDHVLKNIRGSKVFPNIFLDAYEADILEITKTGFTYEYEVKLSKADFKLDAKKNNGYYANAETNFEKVIRYKKDELIAGKRVNYFYYVVPEGLLNKTDIPIYAGLIYFKIVIVGFYNNKQGSFNKEKIVFNTIVKAPKLCPDKINSEKLLKCFESTYYRYHQLREKYDISTNQLKIWK
jgi:hypothetical protein